MNLEEAYDRYALHLYRHALALTRHRADAEDAVQNVFLKLAGRIRSRSEIEDMEAYLHVAIHREAIRVQNRRRPASSGVDLLAATNGVSTDEVERVNQALDELPPQQREVVVLHIYQGMTFQRIGKVTGVSPDTAASRFRYAKEKLKESLRGD